MKKGWIIFIIILLIFGGLIYASFKFKTSEKKEYSNVSIATLYQDKKIKTGLEINGYIINTSETYELLVLEKEYVRIKNFNLGNQDFYEKEFYYNLTENNTRIDIILEKPKYPEIDPDYKDGKILVNLRGGNFEEMKVCLISSNNYLFLTAETKLRISKLEGYENFHSCYDLEYSMNDDDYAFNVTYKKLENPTERDYINISLIDFQGNYINKRIK